MRRGELAEIPVEGVLRPVSAEGDAVSRAGRYLEKVAGDEVAGRLRAQGELPIGGAVITPGGNLSASFVIHVVVQSADEPVNVVALERAILNGLRRATEWGIRSLALPPLGTGPGNLEPEDAGRIVVSALQDHLDRGSEPRELIVVVDGAYDEELYLRQVGALEQP